MKQENDMLASSIRLYLGSPTVNWRYLVASLAVGLNATRALSTTEVNVLLKRIATMFLIIYINVTA